MHDRRVVTRYPMSLAAACAVSAAAQLSMCGPANAFVIPVVDVIPVGASNETGQNSEPSLAVNPTDPSQMISGTFSTSFTCAFNCGTPNELDTVASPYWKSTNGGNTWSSFGSIQTVDKTLAWEQSGAAALTSTLSWANAAGNTQIQTFSGTTAGANFGAAVSTINPGQNLDQPWIRTGSGNQTYVAYNNLSNAGGRSASIVVGTGGGPFGAQVTLETVNPIGGQDAPSVRQAVNGSTVYAAFTRWGGVIENDANGARFGNSQVVVVKSTNSGANFPTSVNAATTTGYFANTANTALTLGQERTGSDLAIAVDPNNANRVVVAYGDAPGANGSGQLQLHVIESTDGGTTWTQKFTTSSNVRSALPALTITQNGDVALLYAQFNPTANQLSQHLLTTTDDFTTTTDSLLGTQSNTMPLADFFPYLGDFYDLTSVGNVLYGIFSASNDDNGTLANYPDAIFQRLFAGTPGTASFQLKDASGNNVTLSIDPFVFSIDLAPPVPEPATLTLLGTSLLGLAALRRRRRT
jgi:PEP-CTERM motif-containing protein